MIRDRLSGVTLPALLAGVTTVLLAVLRTGLWKYDLFVPMQYWGDAIYFETIVKAIGEGGWGHYISRLGMPFGMDSVDFPTAMHLNLALMKVLNVGVRNPFLLINVFWLATMGLGGAFAYLFFRWIGIANVTSLCFGILYGLIPFGFFRNIGHLNLAHFMVPAGAYLGVSLALGQVFGFARKKSAEATDHRDWRRFLLTLGICAAMGLCYIYWAFFTCILIFLGCVIGYARFRNVNIPLAACIYLAVIGLAVVGNVSPTLLYWHQAGPNPEAQSKAPAQADEYALRIRQMLSPISTHPISFMRAARDKVLAAGFPFDRNESFTATLGTLGGFGFLVLLCIAIAPSQRSIFGNPTLRVLAGLVVGIVLVATEGGFGSIFSVFVSHEFRGYNRISPFISLLSFAALGVILDGLLRGWANTSQCLILGVILCLGVYDQIPLDTLLGHNAEEVLFRKDGAFIRQLEARLPSGTMIFQLPHAEFPLDVAPNKMFSYDHAKAYLHSKTLRWSWGNMMGRHDNWARTTARLPLDQFVRRIVLTGFEGILLDRNGFSDAKVEEQLSRDLGLSAKIDSGFRWVFFDLRNYRGQMKSTLSSADWKKQEREAGRPSVVKVEWPTGFSNLETSKESNWRWCGKVGSIRFRNDSDAARMVDVSGQIALFGDAAYPLIIQRETHRDELSISQQPTAYHDRFALAPHGTTEISFDFHGPLLQVPTDPRALAFQLQNFQWHDEERDEAATGNR